MVCVGLGVWVCGYDRERERVRKKECYRGSGEWERDGKGGKVKA